jgi:hypothetical protein
MEIEEVRGCGAEPSEAQEKAYGSRIRSSFLLTAQLGAYLNYEDSPYQKPKRNIYTRTQT